MAEELGGALARVVLQAPKGNVIDGPMAEELARALRGPLAARAHALLLEGEGAHFSYGASIEDHLPERIGAFLPRFHDCFRALMELSKPVLAVVRGQCLGGGLELAAFCHRVFASPDAPFPFSAPCPTSRSWWRKAPSVLPTTAGPLLRIAN